MLVTTLDLHYPGAAGDGDNPFAKLAVSLGLRLEVAIRKTFPSMNLQDPRTWACDPDLFDRSRPRLEVIVVTPTAFDKGALNDLVVATAEVWLQDMDDDPAGIHLRDNGDTSSVVFMMEYRDIDKIAARHVR